MAVDTGHGTTVALTTASWSSSVIEVTPSGQERESLDTSHLGTTGHRTKIAGDLVDAGSVDIRYFFDATDANAEPPITTAAADTLTITMPEQLDAGDPPTYIGTGHVTSFTPPTLATDTLMEGSFTFTWDGETGPTYAEDAAA